MRPVRPAEKKRAGYPRLARAWRILVATPIAFLPSLALGDATIPHDGDGKKPNDKPAPAPLPPPIEYPGVDGDLVAPIPPQPPPPPKNKKEKEKPKQVGMVLHRHAPDEPCRRRIV